MKFSKYKQKVTILLIYLMTLCGSAFSQIIKCKADLFEVDALNNIYLTKENTLFKYNENGEMLNQYKNSYYGSIYSIDIRNPLKILIFYKDAGTIIFLDRNLTEIEKPIDLYEKASITPELICTASNSSLWIFSQNNNILHKLNSLYSTTNNSQNLSLFELTNPFQLIENNNKIYLVAENKTLVFDQFGGFLHTIPLKTKNKLQFKDSYCFYFTYNEQITFNQQTKTIDTIPIFETKNLKNIKLISNKKYIQTENYLLIEKR